MARTVTKVGTLSSSLTHLADSRYQASPSVLVGSTQPISSSPTSQAAFHSRLHLRRSLLAYTRRITAAHYHHLPWAVVQSLQSTVPSTATHPPTPAMPPSSPTAASNAPHGLPTTSPHTATASMPNPTATPSTPASRTSKKSPLSSTTKTASAILQSRLIRSQASPSTSSTLLS